MDVEFSKSRESQGDFLNFDEDITHYNNSYKVNIQKRIMKKNQRLEVDLIWQIGDKSIEVLGRIGKTRYVISYNGNKNEVKEDSFTAIYKFAFSEKRWKTKQRTILYDSAVECGIDDNRKKMRLK